MKEPLGERIGSGPACSVSDGCLTCGDVAVVVKAVEGGSRDVMCEDLHGTRGLVGVDLVGAVGEGERLLVHGGVAIARVEEER
ncbi:MAG TPA: hydrogenase maturation protein [Actinomycetota bacterium]|nr:hydrogenase maturation protein [Actinomycetota bacterium]